MKHSNDSKRTLKFLKTMRDLGKMLEEESEGKYKITIIKSEDKKPSEKTYKAPITGKRPPSKHSY